MNKLIAALTIGGASLAGVIGLSAATAAAAPGSSDDIVPIETIEHPS